MKPNEPSERLCGGDWTQARPTEPFSDAACAFLADLSAALLKSPAAKPFPDVITFAFFCRRAELSRLREQYAAEGRLGRGLVFHVAPGNVAVNFAYSLAAALLSGNASVVKAPSRDFEQIRVLTTAMESLLAEKHAALAPYVSVIRYDRDRQDVTEALSAACDVRVIWGGDDTVASVRRAPLAPHAFDLTFPDRFSLMAASAPAVMEMDENRLYKLAQDFYNDTYLTDQNACSSPRLVYWVGEDVQAGRERFWQAAVRYAAERYAVEPVMAVDKRMAACRAAIELQARIPPMPGNVSVRAQLPRLTEAVEAHRCPGGFFLEYEAPTLDDLAPVVGRRYQTLAYVGLDPRELAAWVKRHGLRGIDRIVPVGHTMDFSLTWDGYDLISTLSRRIAAF